MQAPLGPNSLVQRRYDAEQQTKSMGGVEEQARRDICYDYFTNAISKAQAIAWLRKTGLGDRAARAYLNDLERDRD